jgi:uncharacterized protein (TIGR02421 family)
MNRREALKKQIRRVADVLGTRGRHGVAVLEAIAWPRVVEARFFETAATELPRFEYSFDRDAHQEAIRDLEGLRDATVGDDPVTEWLRACARSAADAHRLVLAAGTKQFYELSRDLYGSAHTVFRGSTVRNIDLAEHLLERLSVHGWDEAADPEVERMSAEALRDAFERRAAAELAALDLEFVVDPHCAAKVLAGTSRVRIRESSSFFPWEAEGLWHHEVETHALTAHNGALQPDLAFLRSGGPRTTRTQEGLAVFAELYHRTLAVDRMQRLAVRVKMVAMAEEGASFIDVYRWLVERGVAAEEAYLDVVRVFRGGLVGGGAPFTKDASHLAGLLQVQAFLTAVVRGGFRDEVELLVCGRIDLDDVEALVTLRNLRILQRPRYRPPWIRDWKTLLPTFAFASFMGDIDLRQQAAHYGRLIDLATRATPSLAEAPS